MIKFSVPLKVLKYHRKKNNKDLLFNLNLNAFTQIAKCPSIRNKVKQNYQVMIKPIIAKIKPIQGKISITYTLWLGNKRRCDISNVCCIVDKYVSDALVENNIIEDDDYKHIVKVVYEFGGIDKENPRCCIEIKTIY